MNLFQPTTLKSAQMALRASLKRRLKRAVQKLYKKEPKPKEGNTIGTTPALQSDKADQPFPLLGLPIELLLEILEILLSATPVKSICHPLLSLRL